MGDTELAWVGLQDLREDLVERDLDVGLGETDIRVGIMERGEIRLHEPSAVNLSAGRSGQDGEMGDERRVHEPWEALGDVHLEGVLLVNNVILGDRSLELDEGDDSGGIVEVADEDSGTLNRLILVDDILDLTQLDTLAAELDLTILSATIYNVTIGAVHCNVTGPIESFSRDEGVGNK